VLLDPLIGLACDSARVRVREHDWIDTYSTPPLPRNPLHAGEATLSGLAWSQDALSPSSHENLSLSVIASCVSRYDPWSRSSDGIASLYGSVPLCNDPISEKKNGSQHENEKLPPPWRAVRPGSRFGL